MVKIAHIHMTLRRNNLVCVGKTDNLDEASKVYTDEEMMTFFPDTVKNRILVYRDRAEENEKYIVGFFPKNKGKGLLVVMSDPEKKSTVYVTRSLQVFSDKDQRVEDLFIKLHRGEVE